MLLELDNDGQDSMNLHDDISCDALVINKCNEISSISFLDAELRDIMWVECDVVFILCLVVSDPLMIVACSMLLLTLLISS